MAAFLTLDSKLKNTSSAAIPQSVIHITAFVEAGGTPYAHRMRLHIHSMCRCRELEMTNQENNTHSYCASQ